MKESIEINFPFLIQFEFYYSEDYSEKNLNLIKLSIDFEWQTSVKVLQSFNNHSLMSKLTEVNLQSFYFNKSNHEIVHMKSILT